MRHLISINDLSTKDVDELIKTSEDIIKSPELFREKCRCKKLVTLFYEPSTRTRLSFEAAMLDLGGSCLGFSDAAQSSATKGESVADTIRTVSCYADIAVIRHPKEGSAMRASEFSSIPVINAGDGGRQHPTQTLTDILTIHQIKNRLSGLKIGLCGDLKFGRTVHSLVDFMQNYPNNEFIFVSPKELRIPDYILETLSKNHVKYVETTNLDESIEEMDVLYMTRVQRERFFNEEEYIRLKDLYILDKLKLSTAKDDLTILHPLPRVNEISTQIDNDPRAAYFKQAGYGKIIRMALIMKLLEVK
ncbi:MAG: aspartate carbamoyltransferase [Defluviitaleaceae bacterium]|nr:aspartate carbamoyltransferase [Defluviitaleaceae bacterium]